MMVHGLVNRAIQEFVADTYGDACWQQVTRQAELGLAEFEAMLCYEDALTERALHGLADILARPRETILEDIGTYLVSHPNLEALRRLLRFGGVNFVDFLHSLDDLHDRARMAVEDLHLPVLELDEQGGGRFSLRCQSPHAGFGHVLVGVLRAMPDDYGALVFLEHRGVQDGAEVIDITLVEAGFAAGRRFDLGGWAG